MAAAHFSSLHLLEDERPGDQTGASSRGIEPASATSGPASMLPPLQQQPLAPPPLLLLLLLLIASLIRCEWLTFSRGKKQTFMKVCTYSRSLSM